MADILLRDCHTLEEYEACVELQTAVWGYDARDTVPSRVFIVARKVGGQIIGGFDGGRLVGFAFAIPGYRNGHAYLHSHMLAVLPEYRNVGLGSRMKLAQREDALRRGIDLMEWTFDPLEIKNAHLNINKLGAIIRRYVPNQYGDSSSPLQGGLPTDRLVAEWWLKSRRVQQLLDIGSFPVYSIIEHVAVPAEISQYKASPLPKDKERALTVQGHLREGLTAAFAQGLSVLQYRINENGSGEFELGVWEEDWSYGPAPDQSVARFKGSAS